MKTFPLPEKNETLQNIVGRWKVSAQLRALKIVWRDRPTLTISVPADREILYSLCARLAQAIAASCRSCVWELHTLRRLIREQGLRSSPFDQHEVDRRLRKVWFRAYSRQQSETA